MRIGLAVLQAIALLAWAVDGSYHVSSSGGNDLADGNIDTPWRTLARASDAALGPGTKLLLKRGDVWRVGPGLSGGLSSSRGLVLTGANGAIVGIYGEKSLPQPRIEVLNSAEWSACIEMIDANATTIASLSLAGCGVGVQLTQTIASTSSNVIREIFFSDIRGPMVHAMRTASLRCHI
jgi:hypothetical protein